MIEIGKYQILKILRKTSVGLYLGDESGEDILLPNKYCPEKYNLEEEIEVFVYRDNMERKIATNLTPKILLHEFALLQVTTVDTVGAFMDWGLEKELLVPFKEQRQRMVEGRWYVVYMDIDTKTDRLYASNKIEKRLDNKILTVKEGDSVDLLVFHKTDLGFSVIINNIHKGLIYNNDVFKVLNIGDKLTGYIKKIREENKIDVSIRPAGYSNYNNTNSNIIYNKLVENNGVLALGDKSAPEDIYSYLGISKKEFKKAIGALYKDKKIKISPKEIRLI